MITNERLAKFLVNERKRITDAVNALETAVKTVPAVNSILVSEREYLEALKFVVSKVCPHPRWSEGPHDTSFCDLCGESD